MGRRPKRHFPDRPHEGLAGGLENRLGGAVYLDTCVAVWFRTGQYSWLGAKTRRLLDECDILISPMVLLELDYLYELRRLHIEPEGMVADLSASIGLRVCDIPFYEVVREARSITWTRDPFDRMIVAHAQARRAPLVTGDDLIRQHYQQAVA